MEKRVGDSILRQGCVECIVLWRRAAKACLKRAFSFVLSYHALSKAARPPKPIPFRVEAKTHAIAFSFFLFRKESSRAAGQGAAGRKSATVDNTRLDPHFKPETRAPVSDLLPSFLYPGGPS